MENNNYLTLEERLVRGILEHGINMHVRVIIKYHGDEGSRVVEPHAIGVSQAGNAVARVYQVRGVSNDMETEGWKLIDISKVEMAWLMTETSEAPRPGYKMGDKAMLRIFNQIETNHEN